MERWYLKGAVTTSTTHYRYVVPVLYHIAPPRYRKQWMEGKGAATTSHYYQPITSHYYQLLLSKVQEVVYGGVVFKRSSYNQQQLGILCRHCLGLCTAISTQALKLNCNPFCSSLQPGYNCFKQSHNFTEPFTTSNPFIWIGALVSVALSHNLFTITPKQTEEYNHCTNYFKLVV